MDLVQKVLVDGGYSGDNFANAIKEELPNAKVEVVKRNELHTFVRLEDMKKLREAAGLDPVKTISADGAANYMRPFLNALEEDEFQAFLDYHLATCEREELLGAAGHTVDIVRKPKL